MLDRDTSIQDGPGWWAAREAIEWTATAQRQSGLAMMRTSYRTCDPAGPEADAVNAALIVGTTCLDRSMNVPSAF
jgi:hypothetical protein